MASSLPSASSSAWGSKAQKQEFFDKLYSFDNEDDQIPPPQEDIDLSRQFREARVLSQQQRNPIPTLLHRQTDPITPRSASSLSGTTTSISALSSRQTSASLHTIAALVRRNTAPETGKMPPLRTAKTTVRQERVNKRRKTEEPQVPEEQQVFRGLTFFFVRNDEIHPMRKKRMEVSRKFGAVVSRELNDTVTHIIVDRGLDYKGVLQYIKINAIPYTNIQLVAESFVAQCLELKKIVEGKWHLVKGCPTGDESSAETPQQSSPPAEEDSSLKVRPRPDTVLVPETPSVSSHVPSWNRNRSSSPPASEESAPTNPIGHSDELEDIIKNTALADYSRYLDEDEDLRSEAGNGNSSNSEDESDAEEQQKKKPSSSKPQSSGWVPKGFQCMEKHVGGEKQNGPNARTIELLTQLKNHYEAVRDEWRPIAYRKAISALARQDKLIATAEEARRIPGIGDRIGKKIEEIVRTDRLERLEYAQLEPADQILKLFHNIYGVGYQKAREFQQAGYKTLDDLRKNKHVLTENQRIGLEHYDDFLSRIPRSEVEQHGEVVRRSAKAIDPEVQTYIMGSYRRGASSCGDIDIIVTKKNATLDELRDILEKLVSNLTADNFLMCSLAVARRDDGSKWHGASRIGDATNPWRRIDFLLVPADEIGAALIYFTGNDIFNRSIRLLASKKGYRLNQKGLYKDVMRSSRREKWTDGTLVESESEKKIFEMLGVPYRPPEHRNC